MFLYLAWPIASLRKQKKIGLGDGGDPELQRAIRVHGNFIEHVPITLLMLWIAEAQGTPLAVIHGIKSFWTFLPPHPLKVLAALAN